MNLKCGSNRAAKNRRDATRIVYEILRLSRTRPSVTRIVNHVNLNSKLANRYIAFLLAHELLRESRDKDGLIRFALTKRGALLLDLLGRVEDELRQLFLVSERLSLSNNLER